MLVVPTLRTIFLSLLGSDSEEFVGFDNYSRRLHRRDRASTLERLDEHLHEPTAVLIGVVLLAIVACSSGHDEEADGRAVEVGNPTMGPLVVGGLFVAFGVFTAVRGTIINNLWWVVSVTIFSTTIGLAVAVLADNRRVRRIAKSLIFMPMAISLVGASIIWRFVYPARDMPADQTGVINAALDSASAMLSTGSGLPNIVTIVAGLVLLGLIVRRCEVAR